MVTRQIVTTALGIVVYCSVFNPLFHHSSGFAVKVCHKYGLYQKSLVRTLVIL